MMITMRLNTVNANVDDDVGSKSDDKIDVNDGDYDIRYFIFFGTLPRSMKGHA